MKIFKQNANENPFNTCSTLQNELIELMSSFDFNLYPDSNYSQLRIAIGAFSGVNPNQVICSNGSDELLKIITETVTRPGDVVISHSPTFIMYKKAAELHGSLYFETEAQNDLQTNIDYLIELAHLKKAKLIYLCNPNNPTGTIVSTHEIIKLIENTNSIVVIDEAYIDFSDDLTSAITLINQFDRLIVLRTFSKGYGLAALRVGYAVSNAHLISKLNQSRQPYNLNSLTAAITIIAIKNRIYFEENIQNIKNERNRIKALLDQFEITYLQSWTNFFLIKSKHAKAISKMLQDENIIVRTFDEPVLNGYFRFSIGHANQNDAIIKIILKYSKMEES